MESTNRFNKKSKNKRKMKSQINQKISKNNNRILLLCGLLFNLPAFAADPAAGDLTRQEEVTILMNQASINTLADLTAQNNQKLSQPPTWQTTVTNALAAKALITSTNLTTEMEKLITARRAGGANKQTIIANFMKGYTIDKPLPDDKANFSHFKVLNISYLLSPTVLGAEGQEGGASTDDLIKMVSNPFSDGVSTAAGNLGELAGIAGNDAGDSLINVTNLAVPLHSFSYMQTIRKPQGDGAQSILKLLESEATRRIIDKENQWHSGLAVTPQDGLLKEIAHLKAMALYFEYEALKQNERKTATLAANLSNDAKSASQYSKLIAAIVASTTGAQQQAQAMESEADTEKRKAKEEAEQEEKDAKDGQKSSKKKSKPDASILD